MFHHENQSYTIIFSTSNFKMRVPYVNIKQLDDYRPLNVNTEYFTIKSTSFTLNSRWGETLWIGGLGSSFSWVTVLYFYFHETSHRSESSWLPATVRHTWQLTRGEEGSRAMDWYSSVCEWGGRGSVCEGRRRIAISPTASNIPLLAEELGRLPLTSKSYSLEVK